MLFMLVPILTLILAANGPVYSDPAADNLIRQAVESSYSLQLDQARAAARDLQTRFPDHPAGYTILAETYWWEAQTDPHNKRIEDAYYRAQDVAVEKAEAALKAEKYPKFEVLAYLGSAWGSYARFQVTQKGAYFSALRAGLRAHKYAEQVYELDKNYYDIYVGLGAFNFFTGSLPAVIKPFAFIIGARGDRDLGLQQLQTAMEKARYSRTEARIVYYTAMLEDKQYGAALPVLDKLRADYPDNYVFYVWATELFREQKKNLEGADYFERLYEKQIKRSPLMAKYALLERANLQLAHNRKSEALATLQRIKGIPGSDRLLSSKVEALEKEIRKG
jgi:hypothetical protein